MPSPCRERLPVRPLQPAHPAQRAARHRGARSGRAGGGHQPLVRRRVQARAAGPHGLRAPLRALHVPGQPPRRQGGAPGAGPGRRRRLQRHHVLRPHQLLRDAALPPAGAGPLAGGRPHGHPAGRADPGEPRQPAGRGQEREAAVLRQPALRLLLREAHGCRLPCHAPLPPHAHRLHGGPGRRQPGGRPGLLPDLVRAQQRGPDGRRRRR